ncbi:hypothetical protein ABIE28_000697 [Devosia sp. 2618]
MLAGRLNPHRARRYTIPGPVANDRPLEAIREGMNRYAENGQGITRKAPEMLGFQGVNRLRGNHLMQGASLAV